MRNLFLIKKSNEKETADKKRGAFKNTPTLRLSVFSSQEAFRAWNVEWIKIIALIQTRKSGSDYAFQHETLDPKILPSALHNNRKFK